MHSRLMNRLETLLRQWTRRREDPIEPNGRAPVVTVEARLGVGE